MEFCLFRLGVCLFLTRELAAQFAASPSDPRATFGAQRLAALVQEFSLHRDHESTRSVLSQSEHGAVVSLQSLAHKSDKRARKLSEKGLRKYGRHHDAEALSLLQRAVEIDPRWSILQNNLGVVYGLLGKNKEAQQAFQQAIELDSSAALSYVNLAKVALNTHQYHVAETAARQALRMVPLSPEARIMLGLAEVAQNHWTPEARQLLEENRSRFPQAELVLQYWPQADELRASPPEVVFVRNTDRATSAKVPRESMEANPPSQ